MNLLFKRSQKRNPVFSLVPLRIGGNVVFNLHAELELEDDEWALMRQYYFQDADLVRSDLPTDLANAWRPAWFLGFLAMIISIIGAVLSLPAIGKAFSGFEYAAVTTIVFLMVPVVGIAVALVMTTIYFFTMREQITVSHLLNGGRVFPCHSVVELDEKETHLLELCRRLDLTLQKAKKWDGRHVFPIPDGESRYQLNPPRKRQEPSALEDVMANGGKAIGKAISRATEVKNKLTAGNRPEQTAARVQPSRNSHSADHVAPTEIGATPAQYTPAASSRPTQAPPPVARPQPPVSAPTRPAEGQATEAPVERIPLADLLPPRRPPE